MEIVVLLICSYFYRLGKKKEESKRINKEINDNKKCNLPRDFNDKVPHVLLTLSTNHMGLSCDHIFSIIHNLLVIFFVLSRNFNIKYDRGRAQTGLMKIS